MGLVVEHSDKQVKRYRAVSFFSTFSFAAPLTILSEYLTVSGEREDTMTRISDSTTREILLETGLGDLAVMAEFDIEGEEYEAEPYSWGGSRGIETAASAELLSVTINALTLNRAQVVAMTSEDHVRGFEEEASERFLEVAA